MAFILLLALFSGTAISQSFENYVVAAQPDIAVYRCAPASSSFTITNTGSVSSNYNLFQEGTASSFSLLDSYSFVLNPGESRTVTNFLNVPCELPKKTSLKTTITTFSGLTTAISQKVTAFNAENIKLTPYIVSAKANPCQTASYALNILNPVNFTETYNISIDRFANETMITPDIIELRPGQDSNVSVKITPQNCNLFGKFIPELAITAQKSGFVNKLQLGLEITQNDIPDIKFAKAVQAANYSEQSFPVTIKNLGIVQTKYRISTAGIDWAFPDTGLLTVNADEEKAFNIITRPKNDTKPGSYKLTVTATVDSSGVKYFKDTTVRLSKPAIFKQIQLTKKQKEAVAIGVAAILAIALLAFLIRKWSNWHYSKEKIAERLKRKQAKLKAKEAKRKLKLQKKLLKEKLRQEAQKERLALKAAAENERERRRDARLRAIEAEARHRAELRAKRARLLSKRIAEHERPRRRERTPAQRKNTLKAFLWVLLVVLLAGIMWLGIKYWSFVRQNWQYFIGGLAVAIGVILATAFVRWWKSPERMKKAEQRRMEKERQLQQEERERQRELESQQKEFEKREQERLKEEAEEEAKDIELEAKKEDWRQQKPKTGIAIATIITVLVIIALAGYFLQQHFAVYKNYIYAGIAVIVIVLVWIFSARAGRASCRYKHVIARRDYTINTAWVKGLGQAEFALSKDAEKARIKFLRGRTRHAFVSPGENVYQYFALHSNIDEQDFARIHARFKISKRWLESRGISARDVSVKRHSEGRWQGISAQLLGSDEHYNYYESNIGIPGQYVIVGRRARKASERKWALWLAIGLLVIAFVGLVIYASTKPQQVPAAVIPQQVWEMGQEHRLDLTEYFKDPDGDPLTFNASKTENITISIEKGVAIMTPKLGWTGQEFVTFTADDGKGGVVQSNKVRLLVESKPLPIQIRQSLPYVYIALAVIAAILLIVMYWSRIVKFLEED